ncbi:smoothelin-like isoform X2 [Liolophura sinensis]|uniref:smoothelin-like isoform X2 n=1 Tax=Liolophura sinensis TaxID=3198878 RepID=UPI00315831A3
MNDVSSVSPTFSHSASPEVQTETKSSFVVKKRENGSFKSDRNSTGVTPSPKKESGADSGSQPAVSDSGFDLSTIHRDIIMSAKIQEIEDEEELHKMLNTTDNFEDRKMIRARLKELREKAREEWERGRKEREAAAVDVVKLRQQRAEEDKKRKMQSFQTRAETAGKDLEDKYLVQTQKDLKDRQQFAADEKQKKLEAYKQIAKTGSGVSESRVTTSKQSTTDDVANNLANKLQQVTSPYTSGKITVRTESWNSQEGMVKKTETTQRWGANKPAGPKSAMAAFKQMDALSPGAAKPNALVTVSLAKKAATTMRRNAVQIKAEILDFCKSNTAEYKNVQITNFSSSWNNGMAFCALIHHFYPDSFDFSTLDPKQRRKNFELAFDTAEKCADIAPLLDVEDMVKMKNPDWKCVFTYVQSFYRHLRTHPNCKQIVPPSQ